MFNSCSFTFAGKSSLMYGLYLCEFDGNSQGDTPLGNQAEIIETRTVGRMRPIHYGVNYHSKPLTFTLVFGSERAIDRHEIQEIADWLTGYQSYQWLSIDQPDLAEVQFRCLVTELEPISYNWLTVAFKATVTCDCPYAYSYPFEKVYEIDGSDDILFQNNSSVKEYLRPTVVIEPETGVTSLTIVNHSDGDRQSVFTGLPSSNVRIVLDTENCFMQETENGTNLYGKFNLNFPRFVQGDNRLSVTGGCTITVSGRYLYNVGA